MSIFNFQSEHSMENFILDTVYQFLFFFNFLDFLAGIDFRNYHNETLQGTVTSLKYIQAREPLSLSLFP